MTTPSTKQAQHKSMSHVLHASLLDAHGEALNEIDNLIHDYAIISAQRNDLLEACKAQLELLEQLLPLAPDKDYAAIRQARAVIQKAEGRAP